MRLFLVNGEVYIGHKFEKRNLEIRDTEIVLRENEHSVEEIIRLSENDPDIRIEDAGGKKIIPGFIDVHTHGAIGVDVNDADFEDYGKLCRFFATKGVTSWLASVLTDSKEQTLRCINECRKYMENPMEGSNLLGIHLEGPFLSQEYKGAMPKEYLKDFDHALLKEYQHAAKQKIRYITVAPEVDGVADGVRRMKELGIRVAIGHSGAGYECCMRAIQNGAIASTHTFNAMRLMHQHHPGVMGAVLESDVFCEAIFDGRHLHPGVTRLLLKTKGIDRVMAVTDSIMAAGLSDGRYRLGVHDVVVEDGDAKIASTGVRAGSTLTKDAALRNLLEFTGKPLEEILPIFGENQAKMLGIFDRKGSIADKKDADLVLLDEGNRVAGVYVMGKKINIEMEKSQKVL